MHTGIVSHSSGLASRNHTSKLGAVKMQARLQPSNVQERGHTESLS